MALDDYEDKLLATAGDDSDFLDGVDDGPLPLRAAPTPPPSPVAVATDDHPDPAPFVPEIPGARGADWSLTAELGLDDPAFDDEPAPTATYPHLVAPLEDLGDNSAPVAGPVAAARRPAIGARKAQLGGFVAFLLVAAILGHAAPKPGHGPAAAAVAAATATPPATKRPARRPAKRAATVRRPVRRRARPVARRPHKVRPRRVVVVPRAAPAAAVTVPTAAPVRPYTPPPTYTAPAPASTASQFTSEFSP